MQIYERLLFFCLTKSSMLNNMWAAALNLGLNGVYHYIQYLDMQITWPQTRYYIVASVKSTSRLTRTVFGVFLL